MVKVEPKLKDCHVFWLIGLFIFLRRPDFAASLVTEVHEKQIKG